MTEARLGGGSKAILLLAAVVILLAAMKLAAPVLVPLLIAGCIAASMMPIVSALRLRGLRTYAAVGLTTLAVLVGVVGFGAVVAVAMGELTDSLPRLEGTLRQAQAQAVVWLEDRRWWALAAPLRGFEPADATGQVVASVVLALPGAVSALGVVFFVAIFILLEGATFNTKLRYTLRWSALQFDEVKHTVSEIQRYLLFKGALSLLTGVACGAWSAALGQPNALAWGLLTFLLSFIPGFGSVLTTAAAALAAALELTPAAGLLVLGGYTLIHNFIGNWLEPRLLGRALGLSPLVIIMSIVVWGWVLGPVGALLSVPLTMMVKIVLAHTEDLRGLSVLLGRGEGKPEAAYLQERRRSRHSRSMSAAG